MKREKIEVEFTNKEVQKLQKLNDKLDKYSNQLSKMECVKNEYFLEESEILKSIGRKYDRILVINKFVSTLENLISIYKLKIKNIIIDADVKKWENPIYYAKCKILDFDYFLKESLNELDNLCLMYNQVLAEIGGNLNLKNIYDDFICCETMLDKYLNGYCEASGLIFTYCEDNIEKKIVDDYDKKI